MPNMIYSTAMQQPIGNQNHQQNAIKPPPQMMNHHHSAMNLNQSNHIGPGAMMNQTMNNSNTLTSHQGQHGLPMQSGPPMSYEHMLPNPMNGNMKTPGASDYIYLNQQHPHPMNPMSQSQYMPSRNNVIFLKLKFIAKAHKFSFHANFRFHLHQQKSSGRIR